MKKGLLSLILIFCFSSVFAIVPNKQSVEEAGQQWAAALQSGDPEKITNLYADGAYLYATFENMLGSRPEILAYFQRLTKHRDLSVKFIRQNIRLFGKASSNSGLYVFSYTNDKGKRVNIDARYVFVYALKPNGWMIIEHHSSALPE